MCGLLRMIRDIVLGKDRMTEEEKNVLERFLFMPVSSSEDVFAAFRTLPGAVERHGEGKQGYLYVPGTRKDRCVLAAHADTVSDLAYRGTELSNTPMLRKGIYRGTDERACLGADDRAGCAMLWLLRGSGHSLLLLDGEEHGQVGAHFLKESDPDVFRELNEHSFILQLDRRGSRDFKCYRIPVTDTFKSFIETKTGFQEITDGGRTDIVVLCERICGVNLSVGYYHEHSPEEILVSGEWKYTLDTVRNLLEGPLPAFPVEE